MWGLKFILKIVTGTIVIVLAAMIGSYVWLVPDLPTLDETARLRIPKNIRGEFVRLSDGVTHYQWQGAQDATPIVLVHGFSNASYTFSRVADFLADQNFRVLTYDLYGRGLSDRPDLPYDLELFDRQLTELLDAEDLDQPFHLLGYSFGGAIVANFAATRPERLKSIIFIAPAGSAPPPSEGGVSYFVSALTTPILGDWVMQVLGPQLAGGARGAISDTSLPDRFWILSDQQERYAGHYGALLSTIRKAPVFGGAAEIYKKVGTTDIPVFTIWGEDDYQVAFAQWVDLKRYIPQLEIHAVPNVDHSLPYAQPDLVNAALMDWMSRKR
jgi:pimeloyl-ACP methyl ester carboxylesterase